MTYRLRWWTWVALAFLAPILVLVWSAAVAACDQ
jgi:hypothetical protein